DGIRDRNVTGVQTCALPISRVNPFTSSISCAYICLFERNTLRRGRSWVPVNFFRTRACLCLREKFLPGFVIISVTPFCFRSYYLAVLPSFRRTYSPS